MDWFDRTRPQWNRAEELKFVSTFREKLCLCLDRSGDDGVCATSGFEEVVRKHVDFSPLKGCDRDLPSKLDVSINFYYYSFQKFADS